MSTNLDDDMKPEYDFSRAQRGRHFAGTDAAFHIPAYLDQDVQAFLMEKAATKGVPKAHRSCMRPSCDIARKIAARNR